MLALLEGATAELRVGDPARLENDVGPVIDDEALEMLEAHARKMDREAKLVCKAPMPAGAPGHVLRAARLRDREPRCDRPGDLRADPARGDVRVRRSLGELVDAINAKGYGLTLGIHSRIEDTVEFMRRRARRRATST